MDWLLRRAFVPITYNRYSQARKFIEDYHQKPLKDFMSTRRGFCPAIAEVQKMTVHARTELFSVFNFIGAYLWSVTYLQVDLNR